jgi:hypothetical protein
MSRSEKLGDSDGLMLLLGRSRQKALAGCSCRNEEKSSHNKWAAKWELDSIPGFLGTRALR